MQTINIFKYISVVQLVHLTHLTKNIDILQHGFGNGWSNLITLFEKQITAM